MIFYFEGLKKILIRSLFYLNQLVRNLRLEPSELQEIQRKRLRAIIKHAYENVPFYHRKFNEVCVKPDDVKSLADLSKLPIITKQDIQSAPLSDIIARNINLNKCTKRTTSGSTGFPLTIYVDHNTVDYENALWTRLFLENGLKIFDKMAVIADPRVFPKNKIYQHLFMKRRYTSIFDTAERQFQLLREFNPDAIKGYPSSLIMFANYCNNQENRIKPRLVFTSAELLDAFSRKIINSLFKVNLIDNYACTEFGLLSWECREHNGYHINVENTVLEFVDNDDYSVAFGERGEIICTGLLNKVMPLIRYRINDIAIPKKEQCSCGRTLPMLEMVEGRKDDFIKATDGRLFPPTIFFPYPFECLKGIRQFRIIQRKRTEISIQLSVDSSFSDRSKVFDKARKEMQRLFGEDMQINFQILDIIPKDPNGKLRKVLSIEQ